MENNMALGDIQPITIARALVELKTIDKKIEKKIENATFLTVDAKSSKKICGGRCTRDEFATEANASLSSINSLVKRQTKLRSAIAKSNASTYVTLCGETITVSEAIEKKNKEIPHMEALLEKLKNQLKLANSTLATKSYDAEEKLARLVEVSFSQQESKNKTSDIIDFEERYRDANGPEVIDPIKVSDKIKEIEDYIDNFKSEVDTVLTESNVITNIYL